jgi:lysyl-tRNA synthetase, class II
MTREVFETRAKVISSLRRYLEDHGYIEVETPMLTPKATGAAAKPFVTHHNALDITLYARIAPELYLKRLVVGGFEKVYELNRNFRNEGISYKHNPEFTMLEFYCAYMDVVGMMDFCEEMMRESVRRATGGLKVRNRNVDPRVLGTHSKYWVTIDFSSFDRISMESAIVRSIPALMEWYFRHVRQSLGPKIARWLADQFGSDSVNWMRTASNAQLLQRQLDWLSSFDNLMNEVIDYDEDEGPKDIPDEDAYSSITQQLVLIASETKEDRFNNEKYIQTVLEIFDEHVERVVGVVIDADETIIRPTFIIDYPKSISPLSKASPENPAIAERFELFINGMEVANGFSELNDPREQYERFVDQMAQREGGDEEAMVLDEDYVRALSYGMPPAAGIGIGIDRLVMLLTNKHSIRDVILFPHLRPERKANQDEETTS